MRYGVWSADTDTLKFETNSKETARRRCEALKGNHYAVDTQTGDVFFRNWITKP